MVPFCKRWILISLSAILPVASSWAQEIKSFVVDAKGEGQFQTIQKAIDSVSPDSVHPVRLLIRKGTYNEKLFIAKSHLALVGEDRDSTRIVFGVLLRWIGGSDAKNYMLYFGDEKNPPLVKTQQGRSYTTNPLKPSTRYHWRVDVVTDQETVRGEQWSFVTAERP